MADNNWFVWNAIHARVVRKNMLEQDANNLADRMNNLAFHLGVTEVAYIPDEE